METYLERLKEVSARMKVEEEERRKAEVCVGGGGRDPVERGRLICDVMRCRL